MYRHFFKGKTDASGGKKENNCTVQKRAKGKQRKIWEFCIVFSQSVCAYLSWCALIAQKITWEEETFE